MLGMLARVALMRFVPRKLVPVLAAWQVIQMLRSRRHRADDAGPGTTTTSSVRRRR